MPIDYPDSDNPLKLSSRMIYIELTVNTITVLDSGILGPKMGQ